MPIISLTVGVDVDLTRTRKRCDTAVHDCSCFKEGLQIKKFLVRHNGRPDKWIVSI